MCKLILAVGVLLISVTAGFAQTGAKKIDPCNLLTKVEIQQVLGQGATDGKLKPTGGGGPTCSYTVGGFGVLSIVARPARADEIPDQMLPEFKKHNVKAEEVKGVGDRAILTFPGYGMVQLLAFKGSSVLMVQLMMSGATEDKEKVLVRKLTQKALVKL